MTATRLLTAPIDASAWERAPGNRHARQAAKYSPAASHDRKIVVDSGSSQSTVILKPAGSYSPGFIAANCSTTRRLADKASSAIKVSPSARQLVAEGSRVAMCDVLAEARKLSHRVQLLARRATVRATVAPSPRCARGSAGLRLGLAPGPRRAHYHRCSSRFRT
jgi:hypothetical protein